MATLVRINLLPVRAVKKREMGRQVLVLFGAVLVLALVGNFLWYSNRSSVQKQNAERIAKTEAKIKELEKVIGEVNNINKRKKELEEKLKVLGDLRKGRSGPVRMLDALATSTPKKVWIRDFDEKNNAVKVTGSAVNHEDVSDFMRSLQNIVWTPKGMGRLVEQKRDAKTFRVELLTQDGVIEDFPVAEIGRFFNGVVLNKTELKEIKDPSGTAKIVDFEMTMAANYAI